MSASPRAPAEEQVADGAADDPRAVAGGVERRLRRPPRRGRALAALPPEERRVLPLAAPAARGRPAHAGERLGLGRDRARHGRQDGRGEHRVAGGRPRRRRARHDRGARPGRPGRRHRHRHHGALLRCHPCSGRVAREHARGCTPSPRDLSAPGPRSSSAGDAAPARRGAVRRLDAYAAVRKPGSGYVVVERMDGVDGGQALIEAAALAGRGRRNSSGSSEAPRAISSPPFRPTTVRHPDPAASRTRAR